GIGNPQLVDDRARVPGEQVELQPAVEVHGPAQVVRGQAADRATQRVGVGIQHGKCNQQYNYQTTEDDPGPLQRSRNPCIPHTGLKYEVAVGSDLWRGSSFVAGRRRLFPETMPFAPYSWLNIATAKMPSWKRYPHADSHPSSARVDPYRPAHPSHRARLQ